MLWVWVVPGRASTSARYQRRKASLLLPFPVRGHAMVYICFRVCYAIHALLSAILYMLFRVCVHVFVHVLYVLHVFACLCEYFIIYIHSYIHTYIHNIDIEIETKKIKEINR